MISVCLASYNGEKYIEEQIRSIISQLSQEDELIISDDGSTDKTLAIIDKINDNRIKVHSHSPININVGHHSLSHYKVTYNFENALSLATGDYIFLADQDDIWEPDKVEVTISALQNYILVMSNYSIIDGNGEELQNSFYTTNPIHHNFIHNLIKTPFHGCCMAFRKEFLAEILPFPSEMVMHDNWIGLYANWKNYKIGYIEKPLIKYRRHQFNVSPSARESTNPLWFKLWYRTILAYQIIRRTF